MGVRRGTRLELAQVLPQRIPEAHARPGNSVLVQGNVRHYSPLIHLVVCMAQMLQMMVYVTLGIVKILDVVLEGG
jgi:hypothetical protein